MQIKLTFNINISSWKRYHHHHHPSTFIHCLLIQSNGNGRWRKNFFFFSYFFYGWSLSLSLSLFSFSVFTIKSHTYTGLATKISSRYKVKSIGAKRHNKKTKSKTKKANYSVIKKTTYLLWPFFSSLTICF